MKTREKKQDHTTKIIQPFKIEIGLQPIKPLKSSLEYYKNSQGIDPQSIINQDLQDF